jgi:hypothetical protein
MHDQPIVDRNDSIPFATSLLAISVDCMIAASTLPGLHLRELTITGATPSTGAKWWGSSQLKKTTQ